MKDLRQVGLGRRGNLQGNKGLPPLNVASTRNGIRAKIYPSVQHGRKMALPESVLAE